MDGFESYNATVDLLLGWVVKMDGLALQLHQWRYLKGVEMAEGQVRTGHAREFLHNVGAAKRFATSSLPTAASLRCRYFPLPSAGGPQGPTATWLTC